MRWFFVLFIMFVGTGYMPSASPNRPVVGTAFLPSTSPHAGAIYHTDAMNRVPTDPLSSDGYTRYGHDMSCPYAMPCGNIIFPNTATKHLLAYNIQTRETHTLFDCPENCYDPFWSASAQKIGVVTDTGIGIYDIATGEYTAIPLDFGVYGYKGSLAWHADMRYVAYEARHDMQMRLMLTDITTGETVDLFTSGVGNFIWSIPNFLDFLPEPALLVPTGTELWYVPIDQSEPRELYYDNHRADEMDDLFMFGWDSRLFWRTRTTDGMYGLKVWYVNMDSLYEHTLDGVLWTMHPAPSSNEVALVIFVDNHFVLRLVTMNFFPTEIPLIDRRNEIPALAWSLDGAYLAWTEESASMGMGFYDLWLMDMTTDAPPLMLADNISTPASRPSRTTLP